MADGKVESAATTEGLPVSPGLGPTLQAAHVPMRASLVDQRVLLICAVAAGLGLVAGFVAEWMQAIIGLVTNLAFYGKFSTEFVSPAPAVAHLGLWVLVIPVIGGIIVGLMARFGSKGIRGHGIPEAMEQVLTNQSKIPPRMTWLKPISAAIAMGTGGPFGAEGPIIATGGALGSLVGQLIKTTSAERKTLLAAGAAGGMAAIFASPVSAVLLAVELLLFEFRPRSLIPVALASAVATGVHMAREGVTPPFAMPDLTQPSAMALVAYILLGGVIGLIATVVTRAVYAVEDAFEHLPIHWMWWPAMGGVAVGVIGYFVPLTLGVGYDNIRNILWVHTPNGGQATWTLGFIALLVAAKFASWAIALGSGTSGGTLAPLFTIGGGLGALLGGGTAVLFPHAGIDLRIAALVGMASIFAGASRAMLASVVFAFETTLQPLGLLPLLGGCTMSYLVSCLTMRHTIMTEKIARRGILVPVEYTPDYLDTVLVNTAASKQVVALPGAKTVGQAKLWIESGTADAGHQGFPIVDDAGNVMGVLTRRNLLAKEIKEETLLRALLRRPPVVVYDDCTLREAADHMLNHDVGRLPVISRTQKGKMVGIITRSDLLAAHRHRLREQNQPEEPGLTIPFLTTAGHET